MGKIGYAAWASAIPAFSSTRRSTTGTPADRRRNQGVDPCSNICFDDIACNLASLNLYAVPRRGDQAHRHRRLLTTPSGCGPCAEISVLMAQFPSRRIDAALLRLRTLGLGYANVAVS